MLSNPNDSLTIRVYERMLSVNKLEQRNQIIPDRYAESLVVFFSYYMLRPTTTLMCCSI